MSGSTIPRSRDALLEQVSRSFFALEQELEGHLPAIAEEPCVEDWTVKQLLAVRLWWTRSVLDWVDAGNSGRTPVTPAEGYGWKETPRLNGEIAARAGDESVDHIWGALRSEYARLRSTIDRLDDHALLAPGAFDWAGRYPLARWISLNTARQYRTARTLVRAVKKRRGLPLLRLRG
ncbi:hypothetical protein ABI59_22345 [Acidobacteria bacterium Mor1]|nr:hypothetical protein ABI59_22345 [Acidobacteria bacterium Mor1]